MFGECAALAKELEIFVVWFLLKLKILEVFNRALAC